jgi:hypothetical protein
VGGDLRIGHFLGLHAMQVLPLLGFALTRPWAARRWTLRQRAQLVWLGGAAYLGMLATATWQALRGQSIVAPDGLTLTVAAVGTAACLVWLALVVRSTPANLNQ